MEETIIELIIITLKVIGICLICILPFVAMSMAYESIVFALKWVKKKLFEKWKR